MEKEKIEEAVKNVQKAVDRNFTGLKSVFLEDDCKLLIQLAQQYLTVKMPEEKFVNEANLSLKPDIINDAEVRREGFNQALHLCKLAYLKMIPSELEIEDILELKVYQSKPDKEIDINEGYGVRRKFWIKIATALHKMLKERIG